MVRSALVVLLSRIALRAHERRAAPDGTAL